MAKNKAKEGFLRRLRKIVSSHLYDLGNKVLNEGIENAKDLHEIEIPVNKGLKAIVEEALEYNKKARAEWKATKSEMRELLSSASKQVVAALKNDKESLSTDEDKFLESLDLDLDDFDFDDSDNVDDSTDDFEMESDGSDYVGEDDDDINSKLYLLVKSGIEMSTDEELKRIVVDKNDGIMNCIKGMIAMVETDDEGVVPDNSKLELAKSMMNNINDEIAGNVGLEDDIYSEDDDVAEDAIVVVEVIPTELPIRESNDALLLKSKVYDTIQTYFKNIENVIAKDKIINAKMSKFHDKLDTVVRYILSECSDERSFFDVESVILKPLHCNKHLEVAIAMFLGIVPQEIINAGHRLVDVYDKIIKQEEK